MSHHTGEPIGKVSKTSLALMFIAAGFLVFQILKFSRYGFDFTDEGYYLLWISAPSTYTASVTQFGYFYHFLFELVGESVAGLRQLNYLLSFGLAWTLSYFTVKRFFSDSNLFQNMVAGVVAFTLATPVFLLGSFELAQSPSYNTLAFTSILFGSVGIFLATRESVAGSFAGSILIGISCALAFISKATILILFSPFLFFYLVIFSSRKLVQISTSVLIFILCLLLAAWSIDSSVLQFVERIKKGIDLGNTIGGASVSGIFNLEGFFIPGFRYGLFLASVTVSSFLFYVNSFENRGLEIFRLSFSLFILVSSYLFLAGEVSLDFARERYLGVNILALPIAAAVVSFAKKNFTELGRERLFLALLFLVAPCFYALGTNRPLWLNIEGAGFFWVLSSVIILSTVPNKSHSWKVLLPLAGIAVLATSLFVATIIDFPMRQNQSLRFHKDLVQTSDGNWLYLPSDFATYIASIRQLASNNGFSSKTPVIDLTGRSPGTVYLLGGAAPGAAWLLGGYPGSEAFVHAALKFVSCQELARAWIITEPELSYRIRPETLRHFGIDIQKGYRVLGTILSPTPPINAQNLLIPENSEQISAECDRARNLQGAANRQKEEMPR